MLRLNKVLRHVNSKNNICKKTIEKTAYWVFEHTMRSLCRNVNLSQRKIRILLAGVVSNDGSGDYFHMLHAARQIQRIFPHAIIVIACEVEGLNRRQRKFPPSEFSTFLWNFEKNGSRNYVEDSSIREKCLEIVKKFDFSFDLPHMDSWNSIHREMKFVPQRIIEYGSSLCPFSVDDSQRLTHTYMGLGPFEQGLIWTSPNIKKSISSIENIQLQKI